MPPEKDQQVAPVIPEKHTAQAEKLGDTREALSSLKKEVLNKLTPFAQSFLDYFSKKYQSIGKTDFKKALGISAELPKQVPQNNPISTNQNPETQSPLESSILSAEELTEQYNQLAALRSTTKITAETRQDLQKQIDQALQIAPNFLRMKFAQAENHSLETVEHLGIKMDTFSPMVDLSAFDLNKLRTGQLNLETLKQRGLKEIVLMEDRDPQFFLNYKNYNANQSVPLNRHGQGSDNWTMHDLKQLTDQLHQAGLKVTIGFWGNAENAANNNFLKNNWEQLHPIIPGSSDINPLAMVKDQQNHSIPFADYIVAQYARLHQDFGFDGLFLGDGLMGYRDFRDPHAPYDFTSTTKLWTDFYRRIHSGVHQANPQGKLWAYDVMGKGPEQALKHGIDQSALAPYLDTYVFQAYGSDAWGKDYMNLPGYSLERDQQHLSSLPPSLAAKTKYTMAFGDQVEGWHSNKATIREKHQALHSHAKQGSFGVWSNQLIRNLI